ncbi:MAG: hypothetical protein ABJZ55_15335 [Fuerstiella sp.]
MTDSAEFQDIRILIPGYSIEDLPTDLDEAEASSLLNAFAVAWHPWLLKQSAALPDVYQAEATELPTGKHLILIPECSESWLGCDWKLELLETESDIFHGCEDRQQWLTLLQQRYSSALPVIDEQLQADFLAFGTAWLQVRLMSRRMHFFVDPEQNKLEEAIFDAADAAVAGQVDECKKHLKAAFECLLDCREQFYPVECYLIDLCLPSDQSTAADLLAALDGDSKLSVLTSAEHLQQLASASAPLQTSILDAIEEKRISILSGHSHELRTSLGSMSGFVSDVSAGVQSLKELAPNLPLNWARKRFGLMAHLPSALGLFGFQSAIHVALDDGLYPDQEDGQLEWRGLDGTTLFATSRLPMAIDGAAAFQKFADRYSESMQEDTTAIGVLARLPVLNSPWLDDLKRTAEYAPVFGQFVTWDEYRNEIQTHDQPKSFQPGEYLSPALIQASVLKTEAPLSSPAGLLKLRTKLDAISFALCQSIILAADTDGLRAEVQRLERCLDGEEARRLSLKNAEDTVAEQAHRLTVIGLEIDSCQSNLMAAYSTQLPHASADAQGRLIVNPSSSAIEATVDWPSNWKLPESSESILEAWQQKKATFLNVKVPPGGFVWLTEANGRSSLVPQTAKGKPLAEPWLLRNKFFEVHLSEKTGGIAGVYFHGQRTNRISQQMALRRDTSSATYSRNQSEADSYISARCVGATLLSSGPWLGSIETEGLIRQPGTKNKLIGYRQKISVERSRPIIDIEITIDDDSQALEGNPWMSYFACRFAWDNESAKVTRSQLGWPSKTKMERFEAPHYIKVQDDEHCVQILTHGLPFHRLAGFRMLDSLLRVEGEPTTVFRFRLMLEDGRAQHFATSFLQPVLQHDTSGMIPQTAVAGWLLGLSAKNVVVARSEVTVDGKVRLLLQETEGRPANCKVRLAKKAKSAVRRLAEGGVLEELGTDADEFMVPLSRFQLRLIEITF